PESRLQTAVAECLLTARSGHRSLFHFYNACGFSVWNSYALICTSAAASSRSCESLNLRCGHESSGQRSWFTKQPRRIAVFCRGLSPLAPVSGDIGEVGCVYSNVSCRSLELRGGLCVPNTI